MGNSVEIKDGHERIFSPALQKAFHVRSSYVIGEKRGNDYMTTTFTIFEDGSVLSLVNPDDQAFPKTVGKNGTMVKDPSAPELYMIRYEPLIETTPKTK